MQGLPPLDRVNSATLSRLAAERGLALPAVFAGEDAVAPPRGRWKRWLPWFFLLLSLFAVGSMAWALPAMAEDGWSLSDWVQLALLVLLVGGVLSQGRGALRSLPFMRRRATPRAAPRQSRPPLYLDAVSAAELAARTPAVLPRPRRRSAFRRRFGGALERVAVIAMVALAVLGFAGMVFVLGYILFTAGAGDPGAWLTAPFTALTGFGAWQVTGAARKAAFRGRPLTILSRAFRDSVRVWGSGSVAAKVALTTTATASVAGAAVAPVLVQRDTIYDLFVLEAGSAAVFRVDLATDVSIRLDAENEAALRVVGMATTNEPIVAANGSRMPKGSLLFVLESANGQVQAVAGLAPSAMRPVRVALIEPVIPDATFTGGAGALYALQPDGTAWRIDLPNGTATEVAQLGLEPGPLAFDPDSGRLIVLSGGQVLVLDPGSATVVQRSPLAVPGGGEVCGIAAGPGDLVFYTLIGDPGVYVLHTKSGRHTSLSLTGDYSAAPCQVVAVPRP